MSGDTTLQEVFELYLRHDAQNHHKIIPGRVTAYDPVTNTAVVKPCVKQPLFTSEDERAFEELPDIPFVPVIWPRAGGYYATLPMTTGDYVLLVFSDVSLAEWRTNGGTGAEPFDARRHSIGWPFAIPGAFPDKEHFPTADTAERSTGIVIGKEGTDTKILVKHPAVGTPEILLGASAIDHVALSIPTDAGLAQCMAAANAAIAAAAALISSYSSHTHSVAAAPGTTGTPSGSIPSAPSAGTVPGSVAATLTKAS